MDTGSWEVWMAPPQKRVGFYPGGLSLANRHTRVSLFCLALQHFRQGKCTAVLPRPQPSVPETGVFHNFGNQKHAKAPETGQ